MADIVDVATRSRMMSGIRGINTKPEIAVRQILHRLGFRFRLHVRSLPGRPDIVLPKYRAVILIHGCFWHGHNCALFKVPGTRTLFWTTKIATNQKNDASAVKKLLALNWRVATVWECALRGKTGIAHNRIAALLRAFIKTDTRTLTIRGRISK